MNQTRKFKKISPFPSPLFPPTNMLDIIQGHKIYFYVICFVLICTVVLATRFIKISLNLKENDFLSSPIILSYVEINKVFFFYQSTLVLETNYQNTVIANLVCLQPAVSSPSPAIWTVRPDLAVQIKWNL